MSDAVVISLAEARQARTHSSPRVDAIQRAVCNYYGTDLEAMIGSRKYRGVSFPRQVAMYLCRQRLGICFSEIGARFGGRDHSTAMFAVRKIDRAVRNEDVAVLNALGTIERQLAALEASR